MTEPLINPDDFKSMQFEISLKNTTTHTEIREGRRLFSGRDGQKQSEAEDDNSFINFVEFLDGGFVLEVPSKTCAKGHNILVEISPINIKGADKMEFSGKITDSEALDKKRDSISVKLVQYDEQSWEKFQSFFSNRQQEIETFFKAVKGF